ncbi:hypothetical protein AQ490_00625 [Wenjunlia vitaminophila]|uniref:Uncharacterized protein n=1 Tax=Wenjunlia vitaminophila TaxID=76728 RepID=A0A0T6M015_WENVI|nr:hypothetical protein [Wenjunlia vitaminophila]KRV51311.1 hypothetical protein AQ490_00625 [Wenjunlia vitaminophila]
MKKTLILAVCTALLGVTACSSDPPARKEHDRRAQERSESARPSRTSAPSNSASSGLPPESRFPVPAGFDNARGWTEAVTEPDSKSHGSWAVAPASGLFVQVMNNEGRVHARRLDGGEEAWTFTTPTALEDVRTDVLVTADGEGGELAVIIREGTTPTNAVSRARPLVTVDTVPMTATGKATAQRHFEFEDSEVGAVTDGLLVTARSGGKLVAVDPATGAEREVPATSEEELTTCRTDDMPPSAVCSAHATPEFTTRAGVVSLYSQQSYCDYRRRGPDFVPCVDGFTVGTAWNSTEVAPRGAADATPLAVVDDYLVVDWTMFPGAESDEEAKRDVVAVHDLKDGRLVTSVDCDLTSIEFGTSSVRPLSAQALTQLSPNGRFLVSGQVGFDLDERKGRCFTGTHTNKAVTLTAVDDDGRAFGVTYENDQGITYGTFPHDFGSKEAPVSAFAVETSLTSGKAPEGLDEDTALPVFVSSEAGLFLRSGALGAYPTR